eukprot:TRINITY_DN27267_c0_g1_i1.p1 TRINITY_DN27267_c0_g1~~TRINITY_DN27267_c0_g1_i1.p1  ORF type:complete len:204 (+),score=29.30 TRINITY_DN27267_c0_g1_i1:208-819(+)
MIALLTLGLLLGPVQTCNHHERQHKHVQDLHQFKQSAHKLASFNPEPYMQLAITAATRAAGAPFGAVIVNVSNISNPILVSTGSNNATYNPTLHAEIVAINAAVEALAATGVKMADVGQELVLITSAESCPMCMSAIIWGGFSAVYFGSSIAYLQAHAWSQIDVPSSLLAELAVFPNRDYDTLVVGGVLVDQCNELYVNGPRS